MRLGDLDVALDARGAGEPVVLAHPATLSRMVWERNLEALAARFAVFAPDLPGHGDTQGETQDVVGFCEGLLDALGLESAHWVGASWGATIALQLAALRPRRVRKLVLVGPGGVPLGEILKHVKRSGKEESPWRIFRASYEDKSLVTRERFRLITALQRRAMPYMAKRRRSLPPGYAERGLLEEMRKIEAPTLVVWGRHDRVFPAAVAPIVQENIRGSRLSIYERSNHFPFLDEPEKFNREVIDFLSLKP
ncbi:MAG: alpha/beta hydrolase [Planctomycetes bacterium]|nr:alpha/beta hydrolase [Planctomycetota bacterium]